MMLLLFGVVLFLPGIKASYCTKPAGVPVPHGEFPDLPDSYQTDIEMNDVGSGVTMDIEEYLDYSGNRGLITYFQNGVGHRSIYSYKTDEIFEINEVENTCKVLNLTLSTRKTLAFGDQERDGVVHIYTARDYLKFGKKFGQVYLGAVVVRGILTSHWQSCMYNGGRNYTADYYFSAGNWTTASTSNEIPVRIEIKGIKAYPNHTSRSYHKIFDFFRFRADSTVDNTYFETPKGIVCPGRLNRKHIPTLPTHYYYRQEIIVPGGGMITTSDVWYDYDYKLVRQDSRQDGYGPPFYTPNPVTQIHDYIAGVKYLKDHVTGNCSVWPLQNGSFDSDRNIQAYKVNHSYVLHMKDPMQLFNLAGNLTFTGVRSARGGVLCDVYTSIQPNYMVSGHPMNATMEFYFLSDGWSEYPNHGISGFQNSYPYQIEVSVKEAAYHVVINTLDFDDDHPRLSSFDISDCYPDTSKIHFRTRFPGPYSADTENMLINQAHIQMFTMMNVSPLRLQQLHVEVDHSNIFINAILLDTAPSWAKFTYLPGKVVERSDDMVVNNVIDPRHCADLCNNNVNFICNGFDLCVSDKTCRLSRAHVDHGAPVSTSAKCDHFSRTISGGTAQTPITKAFSKYRSMVYTGQLSFSITDINGVDQTYTANDVEVTFGWMKNKTMPSLGDQFSYRSEYIIPKYKYVMESALWYDSKNQLVRFDLRNPAPNTPYYSKNPVTYIQDFKTGIAYSIDQVGGNCTMAPINPNLETDADIDNAAQQKTVGYILHLRGPLELLRMDVSYAYAGQKTVRGILCDVFEAVVPDYRVVTTNITTRATFQYFFQADDWTAVSDDGTDVTKKQPLMLKMYTEYTKQFTTVNMFDFENRYLDLSVFDVRKCFNDNQKHHFEITFPQPFHPYLETRKTVFLTTARQVLSDLTRTSPLRFQNLQLTYNLNSVYLVATLLEVPDSTLFFHKLTGHHPAHKTNLKLTNIRLATECAQACIQQTNFMCNSFDFCPSISECLLSPTHMPDGHLVPGLTNEMCTHYSRSVNGTSHEPSMIHVYQTLKDLVYKGVFVLPITYDGNKIFQYKAHGIRDTIIRPDSAQPSGGDFLKQYKVFKSSVILNHNDFVLDQMAVDDCATACSEESRFDCQSFDYCYATGTCLLSRIHPDTKPNLITSHSFCDLYAKKYIMDYKLFPGEVLVEKADYIVSGINSPDMCAKACTTSTTISCHSFEFCSQMKDCRLRKGHILEVPLTSIVSSPMCDHYSRDYVYDFSQRKGVVIEGHDDIVVVGVSKSECAKLCVEQSGMECRSFEFCPNSTKCILSKAHTKSKTKVQTINSKTCNLYLRATLPDGTKYDPNGAMHYTRVPVHKTASDSGAKAGIAIGMLVLGALVSAIAILFVLKWRSRNRDSDMKVQFINDPVPD